MKTNLVSVMKTAWQFYRTNRDWCSFADSLRIAWEAVRSGREYLGMLLIPGEPRTLVFSRTLIGRYEAVKEAVRAAHARKAIVVGTAETGVRIVR